MSKLEMALTLDGTASWFGLEKGVGHMMMSKVITQGGDHIGGNATMTTCCNGKELSTDKLVEKYQGDAQCKNCVKWSKTAGYTDTILSAQESAFNDDPSNFEDIKSVADMIMDDPDAVVITLPTMLSVEHREESPAQADGPSVEVCKVEVVKSADGATILPGHTRHTPKDSKTPTPRKISKPKVHKPLTEPKLFGDVSGAVHTEDRQNPAADDFAGGAQAGTYRGHTSLTSGRDMTGAVPRERKEDKLNGGTKPVRTTMDMPLGRERLDASARTDRKIVATADGAKIVTDRVGGKFGYLNGAEFAKLSRTAKRRYWDKVKKARTAAAAKALRDSQGK